MWYNGLVFAPNLLVFGTTKESEQQIHSLETILSDCYKRDVFGHSHVPLPNVSQFFLENFPLLLF